MRYHVIDDAIEALCQRGCRVVLDEVAALERGEPGEGTASLSPAETREVLKELKAIMSVYGNTCRI